MAQTQTRRVYEALKIFIHILTYADTRFRLTSSQMSTFNLGSTIQHFFEMLYLDSSYSQKFENMLIKIKS